MKIFSLILLGLFLMGCNLANVTSVTAIPTRLPVTSTTIPKPTFVSTFTPSPTPIPSSIPTHTPTPTQVATFQRSNADRPDELSGYQIHVMYVLPNDGADRYLDTNGTLATSVAAFQRWFTNQTGGPHLRFDLIKGNLDITFFRLGRTDADIANHGAYVRDQVQGELNKAGFNFPNKLYAVYYDGGSMFACGGGAWPPTLIGNVAALYLKGTPPGASPCVNNRFATSINSPGYLEFSMIHEILHTLGIVANCAPHHTRAGHVSDDPRDLMYAGNQAWNPSILDVGNDDYYNHEAKGCLDLAKSVFLEPLPADATLPPGWAKR